MGKNTIDIVDNTKGSAQENKTVPWEIAILNLSGLGLGYLRLKNIRRWAIHAFITLVILVIATVLKAAHTPWLWISLWVIWVGWMTVDGWLLGKKAVAHQSHLIASIITSLGTIIALCLIWLSFYLVGNSIIKGGIKAFNEGDYNKALSQLSFASNAFQLSFSDKVLQAEEIRDQSALLIFGNNSLETGNYEKAQEAFTAYQALFPNNEKLNEVKQQMAKVYFQWGESLTSSGDFRQAEDKYTALLEEYPQSIEAKSALPEIGDMYLQWAAKLRSEADFQTAIAKYKKIEAEFPSSISVTTLQDEMASTYLEWADSLHAQGDYAMAQDKYDTVLNDYPGSTSSKKAYNQSAVNLLSWADTYCQAKDYENCVTKLHIIVKDLPSTPQAKDAIDKLPDALLSWVNQLYSQKDYEATSVAINNMISEFPDAEQTGEARGYLAKSLIEWAAKLSSDTHYIQALEKLDQALTETTDKDLIQSANEAYQTTLLDLANDSGPDGKAMIDLAQKDACDNEKTTALGINLLRDQPGKVIACDNSVKLNADMVATIPGTFRYVIQRKNYTATIQNCPYTGGHTLVRKINKVDITLISTITGQAVKRQTFTGSYPDTCPYSRYFSGLSDTVTGGKVSESAILDWLIQAIIH